MQTIQWRSKLHHLAKYNYVYHVRWTTESHSHPSISLTLQVDIQIAGISCIDINSYKDITVGRWTVWRIAKGQAVVSRCPHLYTVSKLNITSHKYLIIFMMVKVTHWSCNTWGRGCRVFRDCCFWRISWSSCSVHRSDSSCSGLFWRRCSCRSRKGVLNLTTVSYKNCSTNYYW